MFFIIIVAIVVLIVLYGMGVFSKPAPCQCCGTELKGTQQIKFGNIHSQFILCKDCENKIHPVIKDYANSNWSYSDFEDYLAWEEETKDERAQFSKTSSYGSYCSVDIDKKRGLFKINMPLIKEGMVFRFADLDDCDIDFRPEEADDGFLNSTVMGNEFIMVELTRPNVRIEEMLTLTACYSAKKKGVFSTKYEYNLSDELYGFIRTFTTCIYLEQEKQNQAYAEESYNIDEIEKALALFMFDSMEDVTEENLKRQRNALIKAFHPDNNESNERYSQKINEAYDLLKSVINK
ncbi:hypothetical protein [Agathobacter sp.]